MIEKNKLGEKLYIENDIFKVLLDLLIVNVRATVTYVASNGDIEKEYHRGGEPSQPEAIVEYNREIMNAKVEIFKVKPAHDASLSGLTADERARLETWVQATRTSIKAGIEQGYIEDKTGLKDLLRIAPSGVFQGSTIHVSTLFYSLMLDPLNIQFPEPKDDLSEDPFYSIDPETQQISCQDVKHIQLTKICRKLFDCLAENYPNFVVNGEIALKVWSRQPKIQDNSIRTTVKKIREAFGNENMIEGGYGKGYRLRIQRKK